MKTLKAFSCQGYNYLPQLIWHNETIKYLHCNKFHHSYHNKNKIVLLLLLFVNAAIAAHHDICQFIICFYQQWVLLQTPYRGLCEHLNEGKMYESTLGEIAGQ